MEEINEKLNEINSKLTGLIEINQTLLKQNMKLSQELYGDVKAPNTPNKEAKELFVSVIDENNHLIYGSATFDSRPEIKTLTNPEWVKDQKAWKVNSTMEEITTKFPGITVKQISS